MPEVNEEIEDAKIIDENPKEQEQIQEEKQSKKTAEKKSSNKTFEPQSSNDGVGEDGIQWDFSGTDFSELVNDQPPTSTATKADGDGTGEDEEITAEDEAAYLRGELDEEEPQLSIEDLKVTAELVIELVDALNSTAVGAWTKEPAERFELTGSKKKTLIGILARVFFQYQAKLGPLAALIIASLLYFGMTWKAGWDIKKEKQEDAAKADLERRRKKQREKADKFRNKILAAVGPENITLKEIAKRMGKETVHIKRHIKILCDQGLLFADHSQGLVKYRLGEL